MVVQIWHSINLPSGLTSTYDTLRLHSFWFMFQINHFQISDIPINKVVQNLLFRDLAKAIASIPLVYSSGRKSTMQVRFGENIDA